MEIVNHRLKVSKEDKIEAFVKANSFGGALTPDSIIIHYTAGPSGSATVRYLTRKNIKVSAHMVVSEDGTITQMVDFNRKAYHAGKSRYGNKIGYNSYAIGIEISNPGFLTKKGDGYVTWWEEKKSNPKTVNPEMIFEGKHRNYPKPRTMHWHKYPQAQIDAVFSVCETLCKAYNIEEILGHEEISPGRKSDPGPAFPLDELRKKFIKPIEVKDIKGQKGKVTTNLNIREAPKAGATTVGKVIPNGTVVDLLEEANGWYHVIEEITGWVSKNYVKNSVVTASSLNIRASNSTTAEKITTKPLPKGTKVLILQTTGDWCKVSTKIKGWVSKNYVKVL